MSIIDSIENALQLVEATTEQIVARAASLGNFGTAGPALDEHPVVASAPIAPEWADGWWAEAKRIDAHHGRIGGVIDPRCVVDHMTDMHPDDWHALIKAFTERPGDGACCTFLVAPTEALGIVQFLPITRNGNHAGGPTHGVYKDATGRMWHPNVLTVGIEFHCAGGQLRRIANAWRFVENGTMHGAPIPDADVEPDPQRPGRGWHKLTAYQLAMRAKLHAALDARMRAMPTGLHAVSTGEAVPSWGVPRSTRFVGHVSLDPTSRSDPWPNGMRDIAAHPQP